METRNTFIALSDGRFEGDGLGEQSILRRIPRTQQERIEAERKSKREYNKRHPEQRRADSHNRRARIKAAGGRLTAKECREIFEKYGKRCLSCGSEEGITLDHVVPLAVGGLNVASNMQPLCMMCNSNKGTAVVDYR